MIKNFTCLLLLLTILSTVNSYAQENDYLTDQLEFLSIPAGGVLIGKSLPPPDTKGSYFLDDEWSDSGEIQLYMGKTIEGVQLKYNMNSNLLYVKLKDNDENFFLEGHKVKHFVIHNPESGHSRKFVNAGEFSKEQTKAGGFLEIFKEGKPFSLVIRNYTYLKKANYMPGADMGRRDNEIMKKEEFLLFDGKDFYELKSTKNSILELFGSSENKIKAYAKANGLNLKDPYDLARIIDYYNSL